MADFQGVIFDMDGVLVDSEPIFLSAINRLITNEGVDPISEDENEKYLLGTTVELTWERLREMRNLTASTETYIERYDKLVRQVLIEELTPQPGVNRLLDECVQRRLPKAVASSALRSWVNLKLEAIKLSGAFDVVLGGDDVRQGKPDPEIYRLAAQCLSLPPECCIAIEDSPVGIAAAVASGAYTIAVRTHFTRNLDISQAHLVLDSLEQFDLGLLANG
ncbi:MAG: HAD family phosphatase [Chloroflexi bacterium]|nr:HAD family phosphatase [Chloroflexota bacterium]MDA1219427.1 HAD family phosphatase [Chloroflexota bacterium]